MTPIDLLRLASDKLRGWHRIQRTVLFLFPMALTAGGCRDADQPTAPARPRRPNGLIVSTPHTFTQMQIGLLHGCAVRDDGVVECWGEDFIGAPTMKIAAGGHVFTQVSPGYHYTCALREDGKVECWAASNGSGQAPPLREAAGTHRFTQVSTHIDHSCALRDDGVVECWGNNSAGQAPATKTATAGSFTQIDVGFGYACGLRDDGKIECWGQDLFGQTPAIKAPAISSARFTQVDAGGWHTCALRSDGVVECWGRNEYGQAAATKESAVPGAVFTQVTVGPWYSCALRSDGKAECWGTDIGGSTPAIKAPADGGSFTAISATKEYDIPSNAGQTCGLRTDGVIECWGRNNVGQAPPIKVASSGSAHVLPTATFNTTPASVHAGESFVIALTGAQVPGHAEATSFTYAFDCGDGNGYGAFTATSTAPCSTSATGTRTVKGTVRDQDNDASEYTTTVEITPPLDNTPPVITPTITGTLGDNGWWTRDVTITWSVTDAESAVTAQTGCGERTLSGNMHSLTLTCSATSAGGTASRDTLVMYDGGPPMITFVSIQGTPNAAGWTPGPVRINWTCSDRDSGVISQTVTVMLSTEGANQSATGICTDRAGNTARDTRRGFNIDLTSPTIAPTVSASGVMMNGTVTVTPNAFDALSGLASATCDTPNTSTVGTKTVQCTAIDNAGRQTSASVSYTVTYQFGEFSSPIAGGNVLNVAKAGQTIPLKWRLLDAAGLPITTATTATVTVASLSCALGGAPDAVEEYAAGGSGLQNLGNGYYQYNWKTPKDYAGSCKTMQLDLGEGLTHTALFQFTK